MGLHGAFPSTAQPGYNKGVIYSVLLFYTVGVFAVGYLIGGQAFDPSEQAKFEAKHWEAQAEKWKIETRQWKQQFNALSNTPAGSTPPCPICQDCPTAEVAMQCPTVPAAAPCPTQESGLCPACPICQTGVAEQSQSSGFGGAGMGNAHHADCDKQAVLEQIDAYEKTFNMFKHKYEKETQRDRKNTFYAKMTRSQAQYNGMKKCLQMAMPSVAEAYEEVIAQRGGKRLLLDVFPDGKNNRYVRY